MMPGDRPLPGMGDTLLCVLDADCVAVVTGATGGIGRSLITELLDRSVKVFALARDGDRLGRLLSHPDLTPIEWDQAREPAVPDGLSSLVRVDVLIHNAGIAPITKIADTRVDGLAHLMSLNLMSASVLTAALLPGLRAARGHVIFVNSSAGLRGVPGWSGYLGSKAALLQLADCLRAEEAEGGVKVSTVYPGAVATELLRQVREGFGGTYDPARCVSTATASRLILSVLDHPEDGYLTEVSFTQR